jgi:hypothetical protein
MENGQVGIFYSCADQDENRREQLAKHLVPLERKGEIWTWHRQASTAGTEWKLEVDQHLSAADIVVLFVSADFFASDYCYSYELQKITEIHKAEK